METPQGASQSPITGNVLFYNKPEPLNAAAHGNLGVKEIDQPFGFLRAAHAVPLTTPEFGLTATSYPIIFVGDEITPVAVRGFYSSAHTGICLLMPRVTTIENVGFIVVKINGQLEIRNNHTKLSCTRFRLG